MFTFLDRLKMHKFEEAGYSFEIPKSVTSADIAVRMLYTSYDHLSHHARSYKCKKLKQLLTKGLALFVSVDF